MMSMKRATTLIACCLVAGALLAGCGRKAAPVEAETKAGAPDRLVQVRGAAVTETVADETIAVTGSIEASTDVSIASKVPGRVVAIGAQEGERVPAGRVLVRLDDAAARGGVTQAEAGLRSARAQLEKASLSLSLVETQADSGVRTAEAALAAARARQESARS
ncbi:MAG TPA: hypothetical protein DCZ72_06770, partial [Armatimonadetes bacterium]|nr:hypothetical protein [Armatimonadota bacterium]